MLTGWKSHRLFEQRSGWRRFLVAAMIIAFPIVSMAQVVGDVDPVIGAGGDGNTIIGPSLPFGMAKPGPDVGRNSSNSGWEATGDINGFSQTHVSGTGGGPKYGNILVQPTVGDARSSAYGSARENERSNAGYYRVQLQRYAVGVEITTSRRVAVYRFTYPKTQRANILFDMGHCLTRYRIQFPHLGFLRDSVEETVNEAVSKYYKMTEAQFVTDSEIKIVSPTEVSGSTTVIGGWNRQTTPYTVYFYAVTDTPAQTYGTWQSSSMHPSGRYEKAAKTGAWLSFATTEGQQVVMKVGISFVSTEQAKGNIASEVPDFNFDGVRSQATSTWDKALKVVELQGANTDQQRMFYSSLYHTMLMPVDRSGENPLWQSNEPYYDDYYAIWDTFRSSNPLLTLIAEERERDIVRALVDIYRHEGWLPDARSGNYTGLTQGGSDADILIADAYVKHLSGIDWQAAYQGMLKDAEVTPPNQLREGRGGIEDWKRQGYLSVQSVDRPASKQMEYALDDYELALMAEGLGQTADHDKYLKRSTNWQNLWDASYQEGGVSGFIRSKNSDGSWIKGFDALQHGSWGGDNFYEGNSWTYSTFVPQDMRGLIQKAGGQAAFTQRLDALFSGPGRYDVSNEPGFLAPYLYLWTGRYDRTANQVRAILHQNYHATSDGEPGNDDSGAISSWYVFGTMGIFPNAGQAIYLIGSPVFPKVSLHLARNQTFVIEAKSASEANKYVESALLNGKALNRAWLRHDEVIAGGRLVLTMGSKPSAWPSGPPPPSASDPK